MSAKPIPERWQVAETYPIEGFWTTQITIRGAETLACVNGRNERQSRERAERIVAAEAALTEATRKLESLPGQWLKDGATNPIGVGAPWIRALFAWSPLTAEELERTKQQLSEAQQERDDWRQVAESKHQDILERADRNEKLSTQVTQQEAAISTLRDALEAMTATKFWQKQAYEAWNKALAALASIPKEKP